MQLQLQLLAWPGQPEASCPGCLLPAVLPSLRNAYDKPAPLIGVVLNWLCLCAGVFSLDSARLSPLFQAAPSVVSGPSTPVSVHQDLLSGSPVHEPASLCLDRGQSRTTGTLLMAGHGEHAAPVVGARHSQQGSIAGL